MGYRELSVRPRRPVIDISGVRYQVDYFGMDDGASDDPREALRFIFRLGHELMIHLYVIQAGGAASVHHFAHSFWVEDCAVAHVDREELGPPASVDAAPMGLPLLYDSLTLRAGQDEQRFEVRAQSFRAWHPPSGEQDLEMTFDLAREGQPTGRLVWSRSRAWVLHRHGGWARRLEQGEWLRFASSSP